MEDLKGKEEPTEVPCEKCGKLMIIKWDRHGHFLACPGYPECKSTKEFKKDEDGTIQVVQPQVEITGEICEKCSSPMVLKRGRFGNFLACSQYPDCKTTKPLKLGVKCPSQDCGGDLVQKRTKKGKNFYSCSKYPTCTFAIWDKPINRPCPQCQAPFLIERYKKQTGTKVLCHNQECGYQEEEEEKDKITSQQQTSQPSDAQKL
jgi:DNA topoisomerase-1